MSEKAIHWFNDDSAHSHGYWPEENLIRTENSDAEYLAILDQHISHKQLWIGYYADKRVETHTQEPALAEERLEGEGNGLEIVCSTESFLHCWLEVKTSQPVVRSQWKKLDYLNKISTPDEEHRCDQFRRRGEGERRSGENWQFVVCG